MIGIEVGISSRGWPAASKRDLAKARTEVMGEVALRWHEEILPKHFEPSAHRRYGYQKRSVKYRKSKNWRPDLVLTGTLKRALTSRATVRRSHGGVSLKMSADARAINLSGKAQTYKTGTGYIARSYPPIRQEVSAITSSEERGLAKYAEERAAHHIEQIRAERGTGR